MIIYQVWSIEYVENEAGMHFTNKDEAFAEARQISEGDSKATVYQLTLASSMTPRELICAVANGAGYVSRTKWVANFADGKKLRRTRAQVAAQKALETA